MQKRNKTQVVQSVTGKERASLSSSPTAKKDRQRDDLGDPPATRKGGGEAEIKKDTPKGVLFFRS